MQLWSIEEIMELAKVRALGLYLSELQEFRSHCAERKRWAHAHREGLLKADAPAREDEPHSPPGNDTIKTALKCLEGLGSLCNDFGWIGSETKIDMTYGHLKRSKLSDIDWSSLEADLRNVADMVIADLCRAKLVKVNSPYYEYINSDELVSEDFSTKFPSASIDVKEAGNCIAVDCGTAAVFHLMRAVEWGMRAFCVDLGLLTTDYKKVKVPIEHSQWEQILNQLDKKIEEKIDSLPRGPQRQEAQEFYHCIHFDIKRFKDAFRNHVAHTRTTYSQKAADDILDHVRKFFVLLETRISES